MTHQFFIYGAYTGAFVSLFFLVLSTLMEWKKLKNKCRLLEESKPRENYQK